MGYISIKETAVKWGISIRRVQALCEKKPIDGRTKAARIKMQGND